MRWVKTVKLASNEVLLLRYMREIENKTTMCISISTSLDGKIHGTELFFKDKDHRDKAFFDFGKKEAVKFLKGAIDSNRKMEEEETKESKLKILKNEA